MLRHTALLFAIGALHILTGCPQPKPETADAPPVQIRRNTANSNANGEQNVQSNLQINKPADPAAIVDPPNPRPTGDSWVYSPSLRVKVGQAIQVQYKLPAPDGGKSWIGLIPEAVTETDPASNDAADVAYAYTVDAAEAMVNITATKAGRYRLRLFSGSDADSVMLGESPLLTVQQWPLGDLASKTAPYLTVNPPGVDLLEVQQGSGVTVHFELPAGYPDKAWIGVIPASVKSPQESDNDAADVQYWYVDGKLSGEFTWQADQPGTYVFRLFPSDVSEADYTAQSEEFTVLPAAG